MRVLCLIIALASGFAAISVHAQTPSESEATPAGLQPIAPPKDAASIEALRARIEQAQGAARAATQPAASQPTDEERPHIGAAADWLAALTEYSDALNKLAAELKAGEAFEAPAEIDRRSRRIEGLKNRDQEIQARLDGSIYFARGSDIERIEAEYNELAPELEATTAQQTAREKRLAEFEANQRRAKEATAAAVAALQQANQAATTQPATPTTGPAEGNAAAATPAQRAAMWRASLAQLREELLRVENIRLIQEQRAAVATVPVLTSLVGHLGELLGRLRSVAADLEAENIQRRLESAPDEAERLYWRARAAIVREILRFNKVNDGLRSRFPVNREQELAQRIARERSAAQRAVEAIDRLEGDARQQRYEALQSALARTRRQLEEQLRPMLDRSYTELDKLQTWRDEFQTELSGIAAGIDELQAVSVIKDDLERADAALTGQVDRWLKGSGDREALREALSQFTRAVATLPESSNTRTNLQAKIDAVTSALGVTQDGAERTGLGAASRGLQDALLGSAAAGKNEAAARTALTELTAAVQALPGLKAASKASQLQAELIGRYYPRAQETMSNVITNEEQLIARLESAVKLSTEYVESLSGWRDALYWSTLLTRAHGWFTADYGVIRAEVREFRARVPEPVRSLRAEFANQIQDITPGLFVVALALIAVSLGAGFLLRRRLAARRARSEEAAVARAAEDESATLPLSMRLLVQFTGLAANAVIWVLPLSAAILCVAFLLGLEAEPRTLLVITLVYISGYMLAVSIWRRLFGPGKARFRIVMCSNVVATHFRRWGIAILTLSMVAIGACWLAEFIGVLPSTRAFALEACKGVAFIMLLLFARRRDLVLRVFGRTEFIRHRRLYAAVVSLYPLVWLVLAALLVLQVLGYGALTQFVVLNALLTGLAIALGVMAGRIISEQAARLQKRAEAAQSSAATSGDEEDVDRLIGGAAAREWSVIVAALGALLRWSIAIGVVVWIAAAWGISRRQAVDILQTPLWGEVVLWRVFLAILIVIAAVVVSRAARRMLLSRIYDRYSTIDRGAQVAINTLAHYTLILLGVYAGLRAIQVDFGALLVVFGGLGLGIGLGLQPLVVNFISGLLMLFERHVRVGDSVIIDSQQGEVTKLSMRSTTVRTPDGIHLVVPNGEFINKTVVNWTMGIIRGQINVGVSYGADPNKVKEILLSIGRKYPKALSEPEPSVWFREFSDSSLDFVLVCWFATPGDRWFGMIDMRYEIVEAFRAAGIEIPFPQRTITFDSEMPIKVQMLEDRAARRRSAPDTVEVSGR